jgi:hypothetical protein
MDMVKFSTMPMEQQRTYLAELQALVRESSQFQKADQEKAVIALPTGDGMALVFFGDPTRAAECAFEIAGAIKRRPHIQVRMGLHNGPVYRVADINQNLNVSGGGINMCQRVMDAGDAGHILVSGSLAETLRELGRWRPCLKDLGDHVIKHGGTMRFYALFNEEVGSAEIPSKWRAAASEPKPTTSNRRWLLIAGAGVLAAGGAIAWMNWPKPAAPAAKLELAYSMEVLRYKDGKPAGSPFTLAGEMLFEDDFRVAVVVSSMQSGCLYVLDDGPLADGSASINVLNPTPGKPSRLAANENVRIPSREWFVFDKASGAELLYLVWADKPVLDFENAKDDTDSVVKGTVSIRDPQKIANLRHILAEHKVAGDQIHKSEDAKKTILRSDQAILVHAIRLEHH